MDDKYGPPPKWLPWAMIIYTILVIVFLEVTGL